jgi:hypothetical protein
MRTGITMVALALVAVAACSSGGHNELPALGGTPGTDVSLRDRAIVSPSYTTVAPLVPPTTEVQVPTTPDWRVSPPTVIIIVPATPSATEPPARRPARTEPAPPMTEAVVDSEPPLPPSAPPTATLPAPPAPPEPPVRPETPATPETPAAPPPTEKEHEGPRTPRTPATPALPDQVDQ